MNKIAKGIESLRTEMKAAGVQAFYISGTDPHQSEYVPDHWQGRAFISGFTGSAGTVLVSQNEAALWTDSRYFLQAERELEGTGIQLMKLGMAETPSPVEWIGNQLFKGEKLGVDASCLSINQFNSFQKELSKFQIEVSPVEDLLMNVWENRPTIPVDKIFEHDEKFVGQTRRDKIEHLRQEMKKSGADYLLITALDDLAWTLNLRGTDVDFNPVFLGYGVIGLEKVWLFVDEVKLEKPLREKLTYEKILLKPYNEVNSFLNEISVSSQMLIDPSKTNQQLFNNLSDKCHPVYRNSIPTELKAKKMGIEIDHIHHAMRRDGVAMVEFLYWLNQTVGNEEITELDVARKLHDFRSKQANFFGDSFFPIVGYREHGAVVHYHVTDETAKNIQPNGFLLVDSGGQYFDGTTDITRTIALSEPTEQEKKDFTLVLKGMIALATAKFPEGTKGCNLDLLARKALWQHGLNYGHGTGHGVGYFLNVHEGPMSIRQEFNEYAIQSGMVISNEPGLYRDGEYGIRIENLIVCVEKGELGFGKFLGFETLTLCPIDQKAITISLMDSFEIDWLNQYHQRVFDELSPLLDDKKKTFLKELTQPIHS
ncbi:aminopeptidase P family protein [Sunxiuqinia sp. A32]|uniref:aminopeptidase P family protein n=1 Tax=Sunxiuqinia sp. A32 TaxID=3461496 RepID=UPI00404542A2